MLTDNHSEKSPVSYYGRKAYCLDPLLVRKKPANENIPDYSSEDIKETETNKLT